MTNPDAPRTPTPEPPRVAVIPEINAIEMSGLSEEPTTRICELSTTNAAEVLGRDLSRLYMTLGEGVFTLSEVKAGTGMTGKQAVNAGVQLGNRLAEEIFSFDVTPSGTFFSFGTFSLVSRRATEQEKEARAAANREARDAAFQVKKEQVQAQEAEKIHLMQTDHALITANGKAYYVPIVSGSAIVAIRALQTIQELYITTDDREAKFATLARLVWNSMPLAERELFATTEKQVYGDGSKILTEVRQVVSQVASPLGMARRSRVEAAFDLLRSANVSVRIESEPPDEPYDAELVTPIFPPGTEKTVVQTNSLGAITAEELTSITAVLDTAVGAEHLDHEEAIHVIDTIMERRSRVLARRILERRYGVQEAIQILDELDQSAARALGKARYYTARQYWTIGLGGRAKTTQQVSGRLPGRTFRHLTSGDAAVHYTNRWNFGVQRKRP